jgi:type IV pilus assembly protein PilA
MITKMRKLSVAGFSLVELMVVVAIIGILAAVAIPNFNKFQRRARAAEGKTALGSLYNSQKSFLAEWEDHCSSLAAIGFSFDGQTRTQVITGPAPAVGTCAARYSLEAIVAAPVTLAGAFNQLVGGTCGDAMFGPGCMQHASAPPAAAPAMAMQAYVQGMNGAPGTFIASVNTNVGALLEEEWEMTEVKAMTQLQDGVNSN